MMKKNSQKSVRIFMLNVLIVIAAVVFAASILFLIGQMRDEAFRKVEDHDYVYAMEEGRYVSMATTTIQARLNGQELTGDLAEYAAVSDYFRAASMYKVYTATSQHKRAAAQKKIMELALAQMGALSGEKERIDKMLARPEQAGAAAEAAEAD